MSSSPAVVCFGHPLLDMLADVDEAFLSAYGVTSGSVNLAQPTQLPIFDKLMEMSSTTLVPGGSSMNTARTLTWMTPSVKVSYVGSLGMDRFSISLRSSLSSAGVEPLFEAHAGKPTGTCAGLVFRKERALLANLGAAVDLSMAHMLSPAVQKSINDACLYYTEGFFLNTASSPDNLLSVATHAHAHGKTFCFNLNAPYISAAFKDRLDVIMPHIDILFGSVDDILGYATVAWPKEFNASDLEEDVAKAASDTISDAKRVLAKRALMRIAALPTYDAASCRTRVVVATCGADDTLIASGGTVRTYNVPPMHASEMVDVNGAGDAFVGGFLAQYIAYADEALCADVGHKAAQICIRHNGATLSGSPPPVKTSVKPISSMEIMCPSSSTSPDSADTARTSVVA